MKTQAVISVGQPSTSVTWTVTSRWNRRRFGRDVFFLPSRSKAEVAVRTGTLCEAESGAQLKGKQASSLKEVEKTGLELLTTNPLEPEVPLELSELDPDNMLSKKNLVYLVLVGIFFTNAIMGELTGGKFFQAGPLMLSIGTLQWPVVFITTDLLNEYYGTTGVRAATFTAVGLLLYVFTILFLALQVPASPASPISDDVFQAAFGQSLWIIFGSVTAFFTSQLIDMSIFSFFKERTGSKFLWLRATGSTIFSQLIDSLLVGGLAFWLPGRFTFEQYISTALTGYTTKLGIAVLLTPLIYVAHYAIDGFLGEDLAEKLIEHAHPDKKKTSGKSA